MDLASASMQRYDHDYTPEPRLDTIKRRLVTVPRTFLLLLAVSLLAPIAFVIGAIVDGVRYAVQRKPAMTLRLMAFGWIFLAAEAVGIVWMGATWLMSGAGLRRRYLIESTWPTQRWWARTLLRNVQRLFRIDFDVTDIDTASPGPIIAMFRHASIIDNLLPAAYLTDGQRYKLRWILKRELLGLPSLDIAGKRLPNYFVDRESSDPRSELAAIKTLSEDLAEDEGVLIYPEGTRFTEAKRRRALERMEGGDPELLARAHRMRHVLPPRLGGSLTLLDAGVDVVIVAHEGLGGFAHIGEIWSGSLVGKTIPVRAWRFDAADIPTDRTGRSIWLYDQWLEIDRWIDDVKAQAS